MAGSSLRRLRTSLRHCRQFRRRDLRCSCGLRTRARQVTRSVQTRRHDCHRWPCGCSSTPFMKQVATRSNSVGGQSWTIIGPSSENPPFPFGRNRCVKITGCGIPCVHAATTNTSSLPSEPRTSPSRANAQRSKCSLYFVLLQARPSFAYCLVLSRSFELDGFPGIPLCYDGKWADQLADTQNRGNVCRVSHDKSGVTDDVVGSEAIGHSTIPNMKCALHMTLPAETQELHSAHKPLVESLRGPDLRCSCCADASTREVNSAS